MFILVLELFVGLARSSIVRGKFDLQHIGTGEGKRNVGFFVGPRQHQCGLQRLRLLLDVGCFGHKVTVRCEGRTVLGKQYLAGGTLQNPKRIRTGINFNSQSGGLQRFRSGPPLRS